MKDYDSMDYRKYMHKAEIDKAMHTLEGMLKGIAIDNIINQKEAEELRHWYYHYGDLVTKHPFSGLIPSIATALEDNVLDNEELNDLLWVCNNFTFDRLYYDVITSDIQALHGMLHGILSDNLITESELSGLSDWLEENSHLAGIYPYDEIYSVSNSVLSDGLISNAEKDLLKVLFTDFIDIEISLNINKKEIAELKKEISIGGICAMCPEIAFPGKIFCFTGRSSKTISRNTIKDTIESIDGIFTNSVSKKTDYLVVGNGGNPCWAFSCYGRKVEAAIELRKAGHSILVVHENDFWDSFADYKAALKI